MEEDGTEIDDNNVLRCCLNDTDKPKKAKITMILLGNGEKWTKQPRDGRELVQSGMLHKYCPSSVCTVSLFHIVICEYWFSFRI